MEKKWLILGVGGVTCGGKTTLARKLHNIFPNSQLISQDDYFLPEDDPRHTWIPELEHVNFDILTSLDMAKMREDVHKLIGNDWKYNRETTMVPEVVEDVQGTAVKLAGDANVRLLILEGFSILNYPPIERLCDLRYFFLLDREECYKRRIKRVYDPPDCPGYFEQCVWPEYLKQEEDVRTRLKNVRYFDQNVHDAATEVLRDVIKYLL